MRADPRVEAYVQRSPPFAQPLLRHLRALVHEVCPDVEETIKWGFPHFLRHGSILCSMAAFPTHCTFGFWRRDTSTKLGREHHLGAVAKTMGDLGRLTCLEDLPADSLIRDHLRQACALTAASDSSSASAGGAAATASKVR